MPRAWSAGTGRDPRWITSDDNAGLREALAPHVGQLWVIALRQGRGSMEYLCLTSRAAPPDKAFGPALYELDFLQCELFRQLQGEARFRTGCFDNDEPPDEEPFLEPEPEGPEPLSTSAYTSMAYHADSLRAWGDRIPERILRHERWMRTGVDRR